MSYNFENVSSAKLSNLNNSTLNNYASLDSNNYNFAVPTPEIENVSFDNIQTTNCKFY